MCCRIEDDDRFRFSTAKLSLFPLSPLSPYKMYNLHLLLFSFFWVLFLSLSLSQNPLDMDSRWRRKPHETIAVVAGRIINPRFWPMGPNFHANRFHVKSTLTFNWTLYNLLERKFQLGGITRTWCELASFVRVRQVMMDERAVLLLAVSSFFFFSIFWSKIWRNCLLSIDGQKQLSNYLKYKYNLNYFLNNS